MSGDFDDFIIVSSSNKKVAADVKKALRKKIEKEHKEPEPQEVWGKDEGYCAWCVNRKVSDPIWEEGTDSQGDHVKYACCKECAVDRGVIEEGRTCENTKHYPKWKHENVKPRPFRYGWNGAENAYEESVDLCDDCFEASPHA